MLYLTKILVLRNDTQGYEMYYVLLLFYAKSLQKLFTLSNLFLYLMKLLILTQALAVIEKDKNKYVNDPCWWVYYEDFYFLEVIVDWVNFSFFSQSYSVAHAKESDYSGQDISFMWSQLHSQGAQ